MAHRRGPFVLTLRYWLKDQKLDLVVKNHDFFLFTIAILSIKNLQFNTISS